MERDEFRSFVQPSLRNHPGIQALYWVPRVAARDRQSYEAAALADGNPGFQFLEGDGGGTLKRAPVRDVHFPIYFLEPPRGIGLTLGFDLASDPATLTALDRAADTGRIAASGKVWLEIDAEQHPAIVVFSPIYETPHVPETVAGRRDALSGFAAGILRIDVVAEQLAALGALADQNLDVYLFDDSASSNAGLLYATTSGTPLSAAGEISRASVSQGVFFAESVEVADCRWAMIFKPTEGLLSGAGLVVPWIAFVVGLLL